MKFNTIYLNKIQFFFPNDIMKYNISIQFKISYFIKLSIKKIRKTALHYAVMKECIDIIKILLTDKNIDVNIRDSIFFSKNK